VACYRLGSDRGSRNQGSTLFSKHPNLALHYPITPRQESLHDLIVAGLQRGGVRPGALASECIEVGPALLRQRFIETVQPMADREIRIMIENVLIPMFRAASTPKP
jgi:hypothetical protein